MPDARDARRAILISAALTGDLTTSERAELDLLRADDPTIDEEIRDLTDVLERTIGTVEDWDASVPSESLRDTILAMERDWDTNVDNVDSDSDGESDRDDDSSRAPRSTREDAASVSAEVVPLRRRPWLVALGAAACIAIGAGGMQPREPSPPAGPPGTLGAMEEIAFTGEPTGVSVDGTVVAHTWGTETILSITGLTEADPYDVVLVTVDGDSLNSGSFLGSSVPIDCQMNAAVMRAAVASVEIQDASGTVVASADLPTAS
jgi:hypothetical protein